MEKTASENSEILLDIATSYLSFVCDEKIVSDQCADKRHCARCNRDVYSVSEKDAYVRHSESGRCIALSAEYISKLSGIDIHQLEAIDLKGYPKMYSYGK